jgi:addiction module HigA family antidote
MIHKPKHPGKMVKSLCLKPLGLSVTEGAEALVVSRPNLSNLLNARINISPDLAVRISVVFKTSDELWINLQAGYDFWKANQDKSKFHLKPLPALAHATH